METTVYTVNGQSFELQHYGVKGMKWGRRKAREEYRELDYRKRAYRSAKKHYRATVRRSMRSVVTDPSEVKRDRLNAAVDYGKTKRAYKAQKAEIRKNAPVEAKLERGAVMASRALAKVGTMYVADQVFYGGAGTRATKAVLKGVGMLTISAVAKASGATNIHWYDKNGRKIV